MRLQTPTVIQTFRTGVTNSDKLKAAIHAALRLVQGERRLHHPMGEDLPVVVYQANRPPRHPTRGVGHLLTQAAVHKGAARRLHRLFIRQEAPSFRNLLDRENSP